MRGLDAQFGSRIGSAWTAMRGTGPGATGNPEEAFLRDEERRRTADEELLPRANRVQRALNALLHR